MDSIINQWSLFKTKPQTFLQPSNRRRKLFFWGFGFGFREGKTGADSDTKSTTTVPPRDST